MSTNFTRREFAKLAGTGALMMSAAATSTIGLSTSASGITDGSTTVAQAATQTGEKRTVTSAPSAAMQRADDLLRQMTLEEKAMQLSCVMPIAVLGREKLMRGQANTLLKQGIGHIASPGLIGHKTPEALAKSVNAIQRYLVTETRLV